MVEEDVADLDVTMVKFKVSVSGLANDVDENSN